MTNIPFFADAEASYKDARFILCGIPFGKTSTFRKGADKGPEEIRKASWNFETYNLFSQIDLQQIPIHDFGDLDVAGVTSKNLAQLVKQWGQNCIADKKFPLLMGGEHSITPGMVYAFPQDIAVVSLDAHMDFRNTYEGDQWNHACVLRRIADYIPAEQLAVLGVRSAEKQEVTEANSQHLFYRDTFQIRQQGWRETLQETKKYLGDRPIYLTIDIDVLDPAYAPGTSTPEPFGLSAFDLVDCIEFFSSQLIGCDIVEVCPAYDHGQTALLAARLIRWIIDAVSRGT